MPFLHFTSGYTGLAEGGDRGEMNEKPGLLKRASRRINLFPTVANMAPLFQTPLSQIQLPAEPERDNAASPSDPLSRSALTLLTERQGKRQRRGWIRHEASVPELNSGSRGTSPLHHHSGVGAAPAEPRAPALRSRAAATPSRAACGGHGVLPCPRGSKLRSRHRTRARPPRPPPPPEPPAGLGPRRAAHSPRRYSPMARPGPPSPGGAAPRSGSPCSAPAAPGEGEEEEEEAAEEGGCRCRLPEGEGGSARRPAAA